MSSENNALSDMMIDEVSLVDRGANQHAEIVLSKREDDDMSPAGTDLHVPGNVEETKPKKKKKDDETGFFENLVEKFFPSDIYKMGRPPQQNMPFGAAPNPMDPMMGGAPAMPGQLPGLPPAQPQMPGQPVMAPGMPDQGQMMPEGQFGPSLPVEVIEYIQHLEEALAQSSSGSGSPDVSNHGNNDFTEEENMSNKPFGKAYDDDMSILEELAKSVADEDSREAISKAMEAIEKADQRAAAAEEIAKAERDHRLNQEYIAKARSYTGLPMDAKEFGPVLKRMHESDMSEEDIDVLEKALAAGSNTLSKMFNEIGNFSAPVMNGDIESIAKSIRETDSGLTKEQAVAKALEENPDLYSDYINNGGDN